MRKVWKWMKVICAVILAGGLIASVWDAIRRRTGERKARKTGAYIHKTHGMYERYFKRFLDFCLSGIALVCLSPVLFLTAVLVRMKLGSPILFTQERPGKDENIFKLYKFRSMTDARDSAGELLPDEERLTGFGRMLRSTSLDELPELVNILKGDMSIVGPRPLLIKYLVRYDAKQKHRHDVRPGLTGLAQVSGRNSISWEDKFEEDVEYVSEITFLGDWKIIFDTVKVVLGRRGISSDTSATMEEFMGSENAR